MNHTFYCLLAVLLLLSCGEKKTMPDKSTKTENALIRVTKSQFQQTDMVLGALQEKMFPQVVSANGMIDVPPENRVLVSAVMGGYIKRTPLIVGDWVKKGQLLVVLENPEFVQLQQQYLEVKEQLSYLKAEYERHEILLAEKISSEKNYLKTESDYKTAMARFKGLRKQLRLLNISETEVERGNITTTVALHAPLSGNVTQVLVSKGAFVSPASPILEIIDHSHIHLELLVFERDIMNIEKGQSIWFKVPEVVNQRFEAEVYLVGTTIEENRTVKVHAHLKNEKQRFLTGMFVEADIVTNSEIASALPSDAIIEVQGTNVALRLVSEEETAYLFEKVEIQTGAVFSGYTQIKNAESFNRKDPFLVKGTFDLIAN